MANWFLKFISGKYQGSEFPLEEGREYTIGRSSDSDLVLVEDMVSRQHAEVKVVDDRVLLHDLGSTNGSFVNGERVRDVQLNEGDRLLFGTSIIKLARVGGASDSAAYPSVGAISRPLPPVSEARASEPSGSHTQIPASPALTPPPISAVSSPPVSSPPVSSSSPSSASGGRATLAGAMAGVLEEIGLPELLQLLAAMRKNGTLRLARPETEALLHLREGRIVYAEMSGAPELTAEKAVYRILTWTSGTFILEAMIEKQFPEELEISTEGLVMEAMRLFDEMQQIAYELPDVKARLRIASPLVPPLRALQAEMLDTLQLVINYGVIEQVLNHSLGSDLETVQDLIYLLRHKYVTLV